MCDGYDCHSLNAFRKPILAGHRPLTDRNGDDHTDGHTASYLDSNIHTVSAALSHDRADQHTHRDADALADDKSYGDSYSYGNPHRGPCLPRKPHV